MDYGANVDPAGPAAGHPSGRPSSARPSRPGDQPVNSALTRFRVMAYVTGVVLLILVLIAMPLKYFADDPGLVATVGPIHGGLFIIYCLVTLDLAIRLRWQVIRTGLVMLAGTVPFMSFVAERKVVRDYSATLAV